MWLFSTEDDDLSKVDWNTHDAGYATKRHKYAHRIVLERKLGRELTRGEMTDHINRDKTDNRRENLRVGNKSLNSINRDKRPDNTTGYTGVYLYWPREYRERRWAKRWAARVERKGMGIKSLGYFKTPQEAHKARLAYLKELDIL